MQTKSDRIRRWQEWAQREARLWHCGVNDTFGTIWYPPIRGDRIPVRQPDYGHTYEPQTE